MKNILPMIIVYGLVFMLAFCASAGWELGFQFATSTGIAGSVG